MSSDNIFTNYKDGNDRLRKERNSSRRELQRVLREKKESYQNRNTEQVLMREELQIKEREKSELVALFKDKKDKDLQKIKLNEKEIETLKLRCRDDNEKMRQSEHAIETLKSRWKDNNDKIQRLEHEIEALKSSGRDNNNQMRQMEREFETLKSRLTGERANQYSAYEVLQNKNDLETYKHQKKALEDERNKLQKENIELKNGLQSLNSKLEQFEDSARNLPYLKKRINDLEEGYRNGISNFHEAKRKIQELNETIEDQNQENRDVIEKLEKLDEEKKDLENKLSFSGSHYKEELKRRKEDLDILQKRLKGDEEKLQELEVLRRQVHKLDFENSELDKRLEINKKEKSSIHKENKELKNILQEKLSEVKILEARLQQYAEKIEDILAQKRHMDKLQSDNDELNLKCRHLQSVEKDLQKLKKNRQQLETEIISQRQKNETLNSRLEILSVEKLEIEDRLRRRSLQVVTDPKNCQNCWKYRNDISELKREINDLGDRLQELEVLRRQVHKLDFENSELNKRLHINNKEISSIYKENKELKNILQEKLEEVKRLEASFQENSSAVMSTLVDPNRPTRLGQRFIELYENEWKKAISELNESGGEKQNIDFLLNILQETYRFAYSMVQRYLKSFGKSLIAVNDNIQVRDGDLVKLNTDHIRTISKFLGLNMDKMFLSIVPARKYIKCGVAVQTFIKETVMLSWLMVTRSNPLVICTKVPAMFNPTICEPYSKTGSMVDYVVWPVLYLQEGRTIIEKGVVACK